MIKRLLLILAALAAVGAIGLAVFIAKFDLDRYRPVIVRQMEKALGRPVRIGRLKLAWKGGIAIAAKGLSIEPSPQSPSDPSVQIDEASALLELLPLLKKELQIDRIEMQGSAIRLSDATPPFLIDDLTLKVGIYPNRIDLKSLSASVASGTVSASGLVEDFPSKPRGSFKLSLDRLAVEALAPAKNAGDPQLQGRLSGSFQGSFQGAGWPEISKTLTGQGSFTLTQGRLANLNILREVFSRLTIIPGLAETIESRLPESYRDRFSARDTLFKPLQVNAAVQNGTISLGQMTLSTDSFDLTGVGQVTLEGAVQLQSRIYLEQALSGAIIQSVKELQGLTDPQGRLELPVMVQGNLSRIVVVPDVGYVTTHLFSNKAEELIGGLLDKALKKLGE
ncbi:MAG: AsmA family protein [Candidatus Omnitrophica bacterium]|nr:AsmA family protein [Candidatus Omnitrophota bacterium]